MGSLDPGRGRAWDRRNLVGAVELGLSRVGDSDADSAGRLANGAVGSGAGLTVRAGGGSVVGGGGNRSGSERRQIRLNCPL